MDSSGNQVYVRVLYFTCIRARRGMVLQIEKQASRDNKDIQWDSALGKGGKHGRNWFGEAACGRQIHIPSMHHSLPFSQVVDKGSDIMCTRHLDNSRCDVGDQATTSGYGRCATVNALGFSGTQWASRPFHWNL